MRDQLLKNVFISFFISFFIVSISFAQPASVELKDGGGVLISSHTSIQAAFNAIPATVSQAYIIEILTAYTGANETYPITFSLKTGTSSTNTITLRPASGNTGELISATASGQPILLLDDADYVIIDGRPGGVGTAADLTFENLATTSSSFTFRLLNGATNNIIRYCVIKNSTMNVAGPRAIEIGTSVSNPTGNSDNLIEDNEIIGGRSCIGLAGTTANPNLNITIRNNIISDFGYAGVWVLSSSSNIIIEGNEIFQKTGYNTTSFGIIAGGFTSLDILANKIYDIQSTGTTTLRGMQISPAAGSTVNVINNFVSLMLDNGTKTGVSGIYFLGSTDHIANIYYNTVRIGGTHTGGSSGAVLSAGIHKGSTGAGADYRIKNNVVLNTRIGGTAGGFHTGFYIGTANTVGTLDIDYNVYFGADSLSTHACWSSVYYSDIALYKTAASPNEQNSLFKATEFVSGIDLHLTGSSLGDFDLAALPIAGITVDIDGQIRDLTLPYKGADEAVPIPVELVSFNSAINQNSVILNWNTATELNNSGFEIQRSAENSEWTKIGFVHGNGTTTESKSYSFVDQNLQVGKYTYRIKQIDFNGQYVYYNLAEVIEIESPVEFNLAQNFPNPFNPSTKINYALPTEGFVSLKVFDILGREVITLVNENQKAGLYEINFDGKDLSSGTYIYQIRAGNFIKTMKMILIK